MSMIKLFHDFELKDCTLVHHDVFDEKGKKQIQELLVPKHWKVKFSSKIKQ